MPKRTQLHSSSIHLAFTEIVDSAAGNTYGENVETHSIRSIAQPSEHTIAIVLESISDP